MSKYINIWDFKDNNYPFQIFIGGRGTGKTYSALSGCVNGLADNKFLFMRRTSQELELMLDSDERGEGANPFKAINRDYNYNYGLRKIVKNMAGIYHRITDDEGKLSAAGAPVGYGVALSTISSIRGVDFSDCSDLIYDEFIPEKHVRKIKDEGGALLNAYETICRNRELEGKPALRMWLLANSNDIYNAIFIELGIVSDVEKMLRKNQSDLYIEERGLAIHLINNNSEFVEAKSQTALYKLTKGTQFYDMALNNDFAYNDFSLIGYKSITGYRPVCCIGKATIFKKKGESDIYVSYAAAKCPHFDINTEQDRRLFMQEYGCDFVPYFVNGRICFESYELKSILCNLIL